MPDNENKPDEILIKERLQQGKAFAASQTQSTIDDLEFFSGKTQWSDDAKANRVEADGAGRPMLVTHVLRPFVNRLLNPLRQYPYGIKVSSHVMSKDEDPDGLVKQANQVLQGMVRGIERRSRASDAYERAAEHQVVGGLGYVHVKTEYESEDGWDLEIKIEQVDDISTVIIDPFSVKEDGSDAKWGAIIKAVPKEELKDAEEEGELANVDIWTGWFQSPPDSVWEMIYYEIFEEKKTLYRYSDNTSSTELNEFKKVVKQRSTEVKKLRCLKYVGNYLIDTVVIPIKYIPLVPCVGERIYTDERRYAGMVHWGKDLIQLSNYYLSQEAEVAGQAPRASWVMAEGQDEGREGDWSESNRRPIAVLKYKPTTYENGQPTGAPTRAQVNSDTTGMIQSRQAVIADLIRTLGMPDTMMGVMERGVESGIAGSNRLYTGELSTAHYADNQSKTVAQVGRIVIDMVRYAYEGERDVEIIDDKGRTSIKRVDVAAVMQALGRIDVDADAGPSFASARRESADLMLKLGQLMPDKVGIMADIIAANLDAPGADVLAERFEKMLPPELKDQPANVPTGEAKAALDAADQTIQQQAALIDELKSYLGQMQMQLIDDDKQRKADLLGKVIDSRVKLATEEMKQEGANTRTAAQIAADKDTELSKLAGSLIKDINKENSPSYGNVMTDVQPSVVGKTVKGVEDTLNLIEAATQGSVNPAL